MKTFEVTGKKGTRSGFGAGLLEAGKNDENVVALCADLVGSLKMQDFIDEFILEFHYSNISRNVQIGSSKAKLTPN